LFIAGRLARKRAYIGTRRKSATSNAGAIAQALQCACAAAASCLRARRSINNQNAPVNSVSGPPRKNASKYPPGALVA